MALAFHFLGSPQLLLENLPVSVHRRSIVALLAYLAVNDSGQSKRTYTRESLSALLWPDYDQVKAFTNLRHILWEIQKTFGPGWLRVNRETIGLHQDANVWVDVHRFESLLSESQAQSDVSLRIPLLTESVKLYRHHFLAGFNLKNAPTFDEWSLTKADELRHKHTEALTLLAEDYYLLGDAESALHYARRLVTFDPLNESAQRLLMEVYSQVGQHNAALKQYQEFEQILRKELGLDPQPETRALYKQIRKGDIKTIQAGTKKETKTPQNNLPQQLTSFIGREKERDEIGRLISQNRLVTLIGTGGIGKTRLALETGQYLLDRYPDGVWFISFESLYNEKLVLKSVASFFSGTESPEQDIDEKLINALRDKNLLLILNSCEHLLEACAQLAETLLKSCPHTRILATSRDILHLEGEVSFHVPSLTTPTGEDMKLLESAAGFEAVRLFSERARLVLPNFGITKENFPLIAEICNYLDGIPLAIELAAALVDIFKVDEVLSQLNRSFDLLANSKRAVLPRHQTMRASLDWSWNLLTNTEHIFMRRLSVFAGGWTFQAAQVVCECENPQMISALVKKSLIVVDQKSRHETRYHFHNMVRKYAQEKLLEAGEEETIRDRHLEYFLEVFRKFDLTLRGVDQFLWLERLFVERDNIRAALQWAAKTNVMAGLYLSGRLRTFWENYGLPEDKRWLLMI